jgi:lysozyme family protein
MTDEDIIGGIIKREGGFVDNPADPGGATKYGITLRTLENWRGYKINAADVEALTEAEAWKIYRRRYLEDTHIEKIPNAELRAVVLDAAVNHGPGTAVAMLQRALGVTDDGILGPNTLAAIPYLEPRRVAIRQLAQRARFYGKIIAADHSQAVFAGGWANRLAELMESVA